MKNIFILALFFLSACTTTNYGAKMMMTAPIASMKSIPPGAEFEEISSAPVKTEYCVGDAVSKRESAASVGQLDLTLKLAHEKSGADAFKNVTFSGNPTPLDFCAQFSGTPLRFKGRASAPSSEPAKMGPSASVTMASPATAPSGVALPTPSAAAAPPSPEGDKKTNVATAVAPFVTRILGKTIHIDSLETKLEIGSYYYVVDQAGKKRALIQITGEAGVFYEATVLKGQASTNWPLVYIGKDKPNI